MADGIASSIWAQALELLVPDGDVIKLALFPMELDLDAEYSRALEISGRGYEPGGQVLTGREIKIDDDGDAVLRFSRFVMWMDADILTRSGLIYNETSGRPLRVLDFGRNIGVTGGLFEVKLPEAGIIRFGPGGLT